MKKRDEGSKDRDGGKIVKNANLLLVLLAIKSSQRAKVRGRVRLG